MVALISLYEVNGSLLEEDTKKRWKYVKPIVKKAMKSGKMEAIGKTKGKEIVYKFVYNYKGKIIEGTCIAKKGVVKLSDAWVKTIGL